MTERYTAAQLDRLGRAAYVTARAGITCEAYDDLPDWRRHRWRQAAKAVIAEAQRIADEDMATWRAERRRSVRLAGVSRVAANREMV